MDEALGYLFALKRFGMKLGLGVMRQLMELLDHPEKKFKSVHVAGTNGKGSTVAMLSSVLRQAEYNVGRYTSPHLFTFNERINVNGKDIRDEDLVRLITEIRDAIRQTDVRPTFFEFTTAIAFLYFAEKKVDIAVIEVGLGGRLDATNVLTPILSIVTNVSLDHTEYLGSTLDKIAEEKAGIIKPSVPVVVGELSENVLSVMRHVCHERGSSLLLAHDYARVFPGKVQSGDAVFPSPLLGQHQVQNTSTAVATLSVLRRQGFNISDETITSGLKRTKWPGRLQVIAQRPRVVVDGAHNVQGMRALRNFLENVENRKVLVIGVTKGKNVEQMLEIIAPLFTHVIVTEGEFKPMDVRELGKITKKYASDVQMIPDVHRAIELAMNMAEKEDFVLVTGSLYMIPSAILALKKLTDE